MLRFALTLLFPFVAALFISYVLRRPIDFLAAKTRLSRKVSAILIVLIFYVTIGTLLVLGSIRAFPMSVTWYSGFRRSISAM